jgi:hypothetical protein
VKAGVECLTFDANANCEKPGNYSITLELQRDRLKGEIQDLKATLDQQRQEAAQSLCSQRPICIT